jgi:trans-aconitate methyltransferase
MKPELYARYHQVYGRFSTVKLFPIFLMFCQKIQQHAPKSTTKITDVGAGTGLFTSLLAQRFNDTKTSLIEPSIYMMPYAKTKLATEQIHFYQFTIEESLELVPYQDIFIFQRSLYALSGNFDYFKELADQRSFKISENGIVGIFEIGQLHDIPTIYE